MKKSTTTPKYKSIKPVRFAKHRLNNNPTNRDVLAVLRKARKHIESNWGQGAQMNAKGQVCALGALYCAAEGEPYGTIYTPFIARRAADEAAERLAAAIPSSSTRWTVDGYNDDRRRTKNQMLALFDRAIANVEAGK